jgi:Lysozyme like domain
LASAPRHRRPVKIRRAGRHTRPSPAAALTGAALKAAPAVALAGALVATAPQAGAATGTRAAVTAAATHRPRHHRHDAAWLHRRHLAHLAHLRYLRYLRDHRAPVTVDSYRYPSGTLGCRGLEILWEDAGGARWAAFTAAEVATAESGGRQYAYSPTNDIGYWQIHDTWGPRLATFNPLGNARAAVYISRDGSDWEPWTTYRTGAYRGQC